MKATLTFLVFLPCFVFSQQILIEDFKYPANDSLENSGLWGRTGVDTKYNVKIASPGLEYPNYPGSGKGNCALISNQGNGDLVFRNFSKIVDSGAVYVSFLLRVDSLFETFSEGTCICLNPPTGTNLNTTLIIKRNNNKTFSLGIRKYFASNVGEVSQFAATTYKTHNTYLAVLKYEFLPGLNNDLSSLYVFENIVPTNEPNTASASSNLGDDFVGQSSIHISNNYAEKGFLGCDIKLDGIRVGTTWNSSVLADNTKTDKYKKDDLSFSVYPIPSQNKMYINYELTQAGHVKIQLVNSQGLDCGFLINERQNSGKQLLTFYNESLPSGLYFLKVQIDNKQKTYSFVKAE